MKFSACKRQSIKIIALLVATVVLIFSISVGKAEGWKDKIINKKTKLQ